MRIERRDWRLTTPPQPTNWRFNHALFAGRDMHPGREGGMWLGVTTKPNGTSKARFAALLNVTGEERKGDVEGRGFIVADYLSSQHDLVEYIKILEANGPHNAFNMVAVELG